MISFLFALLFNIFALSFAWALLEELQLVALGHLSYGPVLLGMLAFWVLAQLPWRFIRENLEHFRVKIHEEIHEKMSLLFFRKIKGFYAHPHGGELHFTGRENFIILLAPYCLPIYTLLVLLIRPIILPEYYPAVYFLLGFTWMFHLSTFFQQLGSHQSDITRYGLFFSYSFILWLNLLMTGLILSNIRGGWTASWFFLQEGLLFWT